RRAFGGGLAQQIAPGIIAVAVAPVFGVAVGKDLGAIRPGVLGGDQAVERVVGERLVSGLVAVMRDSIDIAVVAIAQVEIIAAIQQIAPTGVTVCGYRAAAAGHHAAGLQADIVHRGVRDPAKSAALSADESGERVMGAVGCSG